jgi:AdoMet-dependent rRNA methyltransferase SPB1
VNLLRELCFTVAIYFITQSHLCNIISVIVAKEQGLRSRAAFKLTQINRKFPILQNAKIVLDLCAAPGGWTQICARTLPSQSMILAVDILPIRPLGNNVTTLVGDITTDACKSAIKQELQGAPVDVVLHDGAPNVGASYDKDAYAQNEISLHALKCATQHLRKGGTFVTKLYRSRDYASYVWIVQQFFRQVQAVKPASSRSQSAEIFLVCQGYLAPDAIDARMLDPKCVFEQVDGETTGGSTASKNFNIFHKQWGQQKRHRSGYELEGMDAKMQRILPIQEYMDTKDAIRTLSQATGFKFSCEACEERSNDTASCYCRYYLEHSFTTAEIKACLVDLKVLNKSDFKGLLTWRTKLLEQVQQQKRLATAQDEDASDAESVASNGEDARDSQDEEEEIQNEITALKQRQLREKKKMKKRERAAAAKRRRRAALGMDLNAVELPQHDQVFSLATITSKGDLEAAREVDLDKVTDDQLFDGRDPDEDGVVGGDPEEVDSQGEPDDLDEETGYSYRLDRELDEAYDRYLSNTKDGIAKSGTKMAKRSKKLQRQKAMEEANEDQDMIMADTSMIDRDAKTYAKMLQGPKDSDDEDDNSEEEDDGFHDLPATPAEHKAKQAETKASNPLIYKLPDESASVKTARWFSNPLFESIGNTAQLASMTGVQETDRDAGAAADDFDSGDEEDIVGGTDHYVLEMSSDDEDERPRKGKRAKIERKSKKDDEKTSSGLTAEEILASMPKTDKQIRHEKRLKALERQERKKARKARQAGQAGADFEVAATASDEEDEEQAGDEKIVGLSKEEKKKVLEARALIKAGLGASAADDKRSKQGFEVVSADAPSELPIMDKRVYDSDNEDYDSDDYARTLALGTMMLRKSKAKALVDASYNRFAWNDPEGLPDWFVDDENRHYRPQLPIPPELMAKMKEKMLALSTKPIAKVAEARARKNKRAKTKLAAAKKKAETVANSSEMSEAMKLKAISKAMRGQDARRPGKTYVVSKKGRGARGAKGVKFVDKRMRNDKKAMERSTKKKQGGKKGGLTGSKRRRSHS